MPGVDGGQMVERIVSALDQFYREHPAAVPLLNGRLTSPDLAHAGEIVQRALEKGIEGIFAARRPDIPAPRRHLIASVVAEIARALLVLADRVPLSLRRSVVKELERAVIGYLLQAAPEPDRQLHPHPPYPRTPSAGD